MKWILVALAIMFLPISPIFAETFTDPVAYCKAVGTIDKPDSHYKGPKLPAWMAKELNLKPNQGKFMEWRCADGAVLACSYGANIPCDSKADTSQKPTQGITDYCKQNPDSTFVPMYVTGHATAVSWACHEGHPAVTKIEPVDTQGYVKAFWKPVSPGQ
jgi:hypothetical protein